MNLKIHLKTYSNENYKPNVCIIFNNKKLDDIKNISSENLILEYSNLLLTEINILHVVHYGKSNKATQTISGKITKDVALEIGNILMDNIQIHDNYLWSQYFFPNWSYDPYPQLPINQNRYLGFNGTWQLIFPYDYKNFITSQYVYEKFEKN